MRGTVDNAWKIVLTVGLPLFADADTGSGDAIDVLRTVREYILAGDVLMAEDLTGKGHITRGVGEQPCVFLAVPLVEK
jgi:2-methylisocitrate lyase-like PEP mutase family enzyme